MIMLHKVKSHTTEEDVLHGRINREQREGNNEADRLAAKGAKLQEADNASLVNWIDATAWLVQSRILAVCQEFLPKSPKIDAGEPGQRAPTYTDKLLEQGHVLHRSGLRDTCILCAQQWAVRDRAKLLELGVCPGPEIWGPGPTTNMEVPWKVPGGSSLWYAGAQLHKSHNLCWYRGIMYCTACGSYTTGSRVERLALSCGVKPPNASAARRLKCMKRGEHPTSGQWPQPSGAETPWTIRAHMTNGNGIKPCLNG